MTNIRYALIVIDMLLDFFERNSSLGAQRANLVAHINQLSRAFREHGQPVVWVRQEFRSDLQDAFLEMRRRRIQATIAGTKGAEILSDLERLPTDSVIVKKRYSAFFGTNLEEELARTAPSSLVFAGINTHACVRTTVIDAYQRDHDVIVATDCIGSYDREHHSVTINYLDGKMARFLGNDHIISLLSQRTSTSTA
jgi:nicotinamidase-related amidase